MTKLIWGAPTDRNYETGVDRGVYYPRSGPGLAWNGLISVDDQPSDQYTSEKYYDGQKYYNRKVVDSFAGQIKAYTYPIEFETDFGFSFRSKIKDDGYKIHLVYNVLAVMSPPSYSSLSSSPDIDPFVWDFVTTPIRIPGRAATAHIIIDATKAYPEALSDLEDLIYGSDLADAKLPAISEVLDLFEDHSILKITDHGDGTWTAEGPDDVVYMLTDTMFEISWPSAVYIDSESYYVSSY